MDERLKFIARLLDGEKMAVACRDFGISRKTPATRSSRATTRSAWTDSRIARGGPIGTPMRKARRYGAVARLCVEAM